MRSCIWKSALHEGHKMTRTQLLLITARARLDPIEYEPTPYYSGTTYRIAYRKRPLYCIYSKDGTPMAVIYNHICYYINRLGNYKIQQDVSELYKELECHTIVYLYQNGSNWLFKDKQGLFKSNASMAKSFACDYRDVIPIPYV